MKLRHFPFQPIALGLLLAGFVSACATPTPSVLIVTITPRSAVAAAVGEVTSTPLTTTTASQAAASLLQTKTPAPFGAVIDPNVTPLVQPTYAVTVTIATRVPPTPGGPTNTPGGFRPGCRPQCDAVGTADCDPDDTRPTAAGFADITAARRADNRANRINSFPTEWPDQYPGIRPGDPAELHAAPIVHARATADPAARKCHTAAIGHAGALSNSWAVLRSSLMGIQIHGHLKDDEWAKMLAYSKDLGMGWIKVQIQWKELEPAKGVFNELYRGMVINIQRARIQGFRTMISIAKAPGWSRPAGFAQNEDGPPDNPQDLANFIAQIIRDSNRSSSTPLRSGTSQI